MKPLVRVPETRLLNAYTVSDVYRRFKIDQASQHRCAEAQEWWQDEVEVWQTLASNNEYAAMRLQRAIAAPPRCP